MAQSNPPDELIAAGSVGISHTINPGETYHIQADREDVPNTSNMRVVVETSTTTTSQVWDVTGARDFFIDKLDEPLSFPLSKFRSFRIRILLAGGSDAVVGRIRYSRDGINF